MAIVDLSMVLSRFKVCVHAGMCVCTCVGVNLSKHLCNIKVGVASVKHFVLALIDSLVPMMTHHLPRGGGGGGCGEEFEHNSLYI